MKQATVKLPSGDFCFQEVPKKAKDFWIMPIVSRNSTRMLYFNDHYGHDGMCEKMLPSGSWQLLGADPTQLTEEEAGEIVESWMSVFGNNRVYQIYPDAIPKCRTATASLDSLAASLGISKPYCVLKNIDSAKSDKL